MEAEIHSQGISTTETCNRLKNETDLIGLKIDASEPEPEQQATERVHRLQLVKRPPEMRGIREHNLGQAR